VSCGNAESGYAKQRQPRRNDLGYASGVDGINIPNLAVRQRIQPTIKCRNPVRL
jgi:hypothetical protein